MKLEQPQALYRALSFSQRAINEDDRTAEFVAASETPVQTFDGPEILVVDGMDTARFESNPIILDAHDRRESLSVIGRAVELKKEDGNLIAKVQFAETERAGEIWSLVKGGFLRAVSVGFMVQQVRFLEEGARAELASGTVEGPAVLVTQSELLEISTVPVPADKHALLMRDFMSAIKGIRAMKEMQRSEGGPTFSFSTAMPDQGLPAEEGGKVEGEKGEETTIIDLPQEIRARAAQAEAEEAAAEAQRIVSVVQAVLAFTPEHLHDVARKAVAGAERGNELEDARNAVLESWSKQAQPVGTPEPTPVKDTPVTQKRELSSSEFLNAFTS